MATQMLPYGHGLGDYNYGDWDADGNYSGGYGTDRPWWADLASQGIDVFGGRKGVPTRGGYPYGTYPQQYPGAQTQTVGLNPSGVQINWTVVAAVAVGFLLFTSGRRR